MRQLRSCAAAAALALAAGAAGAAPPAILEVEARSDGAGWTFEVTLRHPDTGWDHYADAWAVLAPDGTDLGRRTLLHPHVEEQPFTRALAGVQVPEDLGSVLIRAHCLVDGWAAETVEVTLPRD
jgi:hypothetical protein